MEASPPHYTTSVNLRQACAVAPPHGSTVGVVPKLAGIATGTGNRPHGPDAEIAVQPHNSSLPASSSLPAP
ncbi:unnamed protein product [Prunus armeniaca]